MGSTFNSSSSSDSYDLSFKILFIGDAGVGKSSLILSFDSSSEQKENLPPTIGVDFRIKIFTVGGKTLKFTIWDTAGQEKFKTLTPFYYRDAHGIILVYDVTRRETLTNLTNIWSKELMQYSTNQKFIRVLVGNKVDKESERVVTKEEGTALAKELGCLFFECSAKTGENVEKCFEELALKMLTDPILLELGSKDVNKANKNTQVYGAPPGGGGCGCG
ncbi:ras-related protein RABC2a [Cinnamomum micranthum f. kanehirae]|uniref:Ras-related protein RABC2a n=1 Tax=Cinnamomum micranthum f. kanehirae TaxID=337451 RepID=A0A443PVH8_9MAGN|nr:ras-related protein RABC2a [Cinnamomum micranthum f. kanehirae]